MTPLSASELETLPRTMATQIQPLFHRADTIRYSHFLNAMYHYTLQSEAELEHAADLAPTEPLRQLFVHLAREEKAHYQLAEQDLKTLQKTPTPNAPPAVLELRNYWNQVCEENFFELLGGLYVLENVAAHVMESTVACMELLSLAPCQMSFVTTHLEADAEHGQLLKEACTQNWNKHHQDIVRGAEKIASLWVTMHLEAIRPEQELP